MEPIPGKSGNIASILHRCILLMTLMLLVPAVAFSQTEKISVSASGEPLSSVLDRIEKESGYRFYYNSSLIDAGRKVTADIKGESIEDVLSVLFRNMDIEFKILDNRDIILSVKEAGHDSGKTDSAAPVTVTGCVTDENGAAMPYVYVTVDGTSTYTTTDDNGMYVIEVPDKNSVLRFSFLGYKDAERAVSGKKRIDLVMYSEINELDDVVVVGFGTQKKVNLTGAVGTVSSDDLKDRPVSNLQQALQGLVPGLNISQSSGFIDSTPSYNIRVSAN